MKDRIRVGLDFDGVVAYNPLRIVRWPIAYFKRQILGINKLSFFYPQANWQKYIWKILHESSIFPAKGTGLLKKLVKQGNIEVHLVTARYSFLDDHLYQWLEKYHLRKLFKTINLNKQDEQPHLFKEKMVRKYRLDYFVEDNWDIVKYLNSQPKAGRPLAEKQDVKIYWIYNILDRGTVYSYKFPYLEKALEQIVKK